MAFSHATWSLVPALQSRTAPVVIHPIFIECTNPARSQTFSESRLWLCVPAILAQPLDVLSGFRRGQQVHTSHSRLPTITQDTANICPLPNAPMLHHRYRQQNYILPYRGWAAPPCVLVDSTWVNVRSATSVGDGLPIPEIYLLSSSFILLW